MKPREDRQKVMLDARMRCSGGYRDVSIRDVSSRGMLIHAELPPAQGTYVEILRPNCSVAARVVWANGNRFGVRLQNRVSPAAVIERRSIRRDASSVAPAVQGNRSPAAAAARQADLNRWRSAMLQFVFLAGMAALGAGALAMLIYSYLAPTFAVIADRLN